MKLGALVLPSDFFKCTKMEMENHQELLQLKGSKDCLAKNVETDWELQK